MEICGLITLVNGHWQQPGDPESPRGPAWARFLGGGAAGQEGLRR